MQPDRATVDRIADLDVDAPRRPVDDWSAGDEPDFVVRPGPRRRRITGGHDGAVRPAHADPAPPRRGIVVEGDVPSRRHVDAWIDDDFGLLDGARPGRGAGAARSAAAEPADLVGPGEPGFDPPVDRASERTTPTEAPRQGRRTRPDSDPGATRDPGGRRTVAITGRPERLHSGTPLREIERRRPVARPAERIGSRPDRIAMWAVALGFALILIAAASSKAEAATKLGDRTLEQGMVGRDVRHLQLRLTRLDLFDAPATARFGTLTRRAVVRYQRSRCLTADGIVGSGTVRALRAGRARCRAASSPRRSSGDRSDRRRYRRVHLGTRTVARGMAGRDVRTVQRLLGVDVTGVFGPVTQRAVRRFQSRSGLGVDGAVGPATKAALVRREMKVRRATWYGPGLYGNRTACGQKLTKRLAGVAHRSLPCGSPVTIHHEGRFVTVKVVDRGPFVRGVSYDLTAATARALGVRSTVSLRVAS